MNQSSYIAAALLGGFVLYLAAKGRLPVYAAVLWGPTAATPPAPSSSGSSGGSGIVGAIGTAANVAAVLA